VLGLGFPERDGLADLGDDRAGPQAGRLDVGDRVLGDLALLVARGEDLRAIVGPDVPALAIIGRRVMDLEEELEDVAVGDPLGLPPLAKDARTNERDPDYALTVVGLLAYVAVVAGFLALLDIAA